MTDPLTQRIDRALRSIVNPRTGADVVSAEMVRDIATTTDGKVRLTLLLDARDDATLVRAVRHAVEGVDGVAEVRVDPKDPAEFAARSRPAPPMPPPPRPPGTSRALPVMDAAPAPARPTVPPPVVYPNLGRVIAVSSGKGGVGKSTVTTNVAVALARRGLRVGLMDADVYGPNIPRMLGVDAPLPVANEKIVPNEAFGVKVVSLGFLIERDQPAIWRGPIVMKIITQFLRDVEWGQLDVLLVDMPPGTGDAQLSLVQATQVHGAIIVTTPQLVAVGDALRGARMFERVGVPVLGIVENMSWFENPETGTPIPIFGSGGGDELARELGVPILAHVPLHPRIVQAGDEGNPIVRSDPGAAASKALVQVADAIATPAGAASAR
ncbi:MAG: Mrp/NBP35 family ATP-binding protein [Gemmatimonadetes bacterium]|nr:Mrp/NBP35 family ATP-binding protein [Gemmatimonadota bacterium]